MDNHNSQSRIQPAPFNDFELDRRDKWAKYVLIGAIILFFLGAASFAMNIIVYMAYPKLYPVALFVVSLIFEALYVLTGIIGVIASCKKTYFCSKFYLIAICTLAGIIFAWNFVTFGISGILATFIVSIIFIVCCCSCFVICAYKYFARSKEIELKQRPLNNSNFVNDSLGQPQFVQQGPNGKNSSSPV